jgi:LmbE family N-acetylglucosaminyl deacetylase
MLQLAHPSAVVKDSGRPDVVADLAAILRATTPDVVYLHNPADKHDTHVACFWRCLAALRSLPARLRPQAVYGCEVWRNLDWLPDTDKIALDDSADPRLAAKLIGHFSRRSPAASATTWPSPAAGSPTPLFTPRTPRIRPPRSLGRWS